VPPPDLGRARRETNESPHGGPAFNVDDMDAYGLGDTLTLEARPFSNFIFDGWDGDLQGATNPAHLHMTASKHVRARMKKQ
jgi:hypothetical protein